MSTQEAKSSRFPSNESFPVEMHVTPDSSRLVRNDDLVLAELSITKSRGATVFTEFLSTAKAMYETEIDSENELPLSVIISRYSTSDVEPVTGGGCDVYIEDERGIECVSWTLDEWWDEEHDQIDERVAASILNAVAMAYEQPQALIERTAP